MPMCNKPSSPFLVERRVETVSLIVEFLENILPSTATSSQFPSIVILFIETYLFHLIKTSDEIQHDYMDV